MIEITPVVMDMECGRFAGRPSDKSKDAEKLLPGSRLPVSNPFLSQRLGRSSYPNRKLSYHTNPSIESASPADNICVGCPTLPQWAAIIMGLVLVIFSIFQMRPLNPPQTA